jgi:glycosyltransferase involved in cell wall biosynthesis
MPGTETVTLGVPVYRGEPFIEETLRSLQAQTHRQFEVIISFDGPDPGAQEKCQPFLKDSRFRLVVQPERLGWVANINWLMSQVDTDFWCYQQQDDLIDPPYLERLVDYARQAPEAAVVYSDLVIFGSKSGRMTQTSVTGGAVARQLALLHEHHAAIPFRGLTRVEALRACGGIRPNEIEDFSADTTWMAVIARWGELHRVPGFLYHKRYHSENEHTKWAAWPAAKRAKAWMVHCTDMLEQAMLIDATPQERRLLWLAAVARLVSPRTARVAISFAKLTPADRLSLLESFFEYVSTARSMKIPCLLNARWQDVKQWTKGFYWLPDEAVDG